MPVLKLLLYMSTEIFLWMGFKVKKAVVSCHKCQVFRNNYLQIKKPIKENADPMLKLNVLVKNSFLTNSGLLVSNMKLQQILLRPFLKFYKKRFRHKCFRINFSKILRTPFLQNFSGQLLLALSISWLLCPN